MGGTKSSKLKNGLRTIVPRYIVPRCHVESGEVPRRRLALRDRHTGRWVKPSRLVDCRGGSSRQRDLVIVVAREGRPSRAPCMPGSRWHAASAARSVLIAPPSRRHAPATIQTTAPGAVRLRPARTGSPLVRNCCDALKPSLCPRHASAASSRAQASMSAIVSASRSCRASGVRPNSPAKRDICHLRHRQRSSLVSCCEHCLHWT